MKLIFIDIDGVLNSSSGTGPYVSDMEIDKLILLKQLIDETKSSGIVITSDRRYSDVDMKSKLAAFKQYQIPVIGQLRLPDDNDPDDNRGKQIMDYISSQKENIDKIVILDDIDDGISELFFEDFIIVNRVFGLNKDIYKRVVETLNQ
ncbi:MAG: hypothetical protein J5666_02130 [Bacilli bacterium]|nr:hypothetical protein [Bacilli bacterium]